MVRAWEAEFIRRWEAGETCEQIGAALGIPAGTARSRAYTLQQVGKIQPRPRGGKRVRSTVHPATEDRPPSTVDPVPSTVEAEPWELHQLKHSVRWTIYMPQTLKAEIQRRAQARGQPPSVFLQELIWNALNDHHPSTP
jgi:hypothetical protein